MEVRWIKLVTDIFDDEKMRLIGSEKDGDTLQLIWIRLLCLAGRCNSGGLLELTDDMPLSDKMLAVLLGKPLPVVRRALRLFERYGMITKDGAYAVTNWGKHQSLDKPEKDRESARQRTAACRARKRQRESGEVVTEDEESCNADVTLPERYTSVTVTDCNTYRNRIRIRDKEDKKEKERHKEKDAVYDSPGPPEGDVTVDEIIDSTEDGTRETKSRRVKPKADDALFNAFWDAYPKKMSR